MGVGQLDNLLVCLLVGLKSRLRVVVLIAYQPDVEVGLGELLCEEGLYFRKPGKLVLPHCGLEVLQRLLELLALEMDASQVEVGLDVVLVVLQGLSVDLDQLREDPERCTCLVLLATLASIAYLSMPGRS